MLFNVLLCLIAALTVLVLTACVTLLFGYYWLSSRLRQRMAEVRELEFLMARSRIPGLGLDVDADYAWVRQHVPPMEINLVRTPAAPDDQLIARIDQWLREHRFEYLGSFRIQPLDELLFTYLNEDRTLVAAIRDANQPERIHMEFCFDLGDDERGGVSNPPADILPLPDAAVGHFIHQSIRDDFSVLSRLWLEAVELLDTPEVAARLQTIDPSDINLFYEAAHRSEMQQRVRGGGVSEEELRRSFEAQGITATDNDIAEIQQAWQLAIQQHWIARSPRARQHARQGSEVLAVSDSSLSDFLLERISSFLTTRPELAGGELTNNLEDLRQLLAIFSPRDALARFRPLLPAQSRYRLVDQIQQPLPVDFYVLPSDTA